MEAVINNRLLIGSAEDFKILEYNLARTPLSWNARFHWMLNNWIDFGYSKKVPQFNESNWRTIFVPLAER